MKIALASPPFPYSLEEGLEFIRKFTKDAADKGASILCFPESFLPGYPGMDFSPMDRTPERLEWAMQEARKIAASTGIALILPMDAFIEDHWYNLAYVISKEGELLGYQTKNQLDPSEDNIWKPGDQRHIFEINGLKFGIVICHEGFRYPELVRWAARKGAQIVFHPHFAGSNVEGKKPESWGSMESPYYEKAMMMRALENTIYFASVNYACTFPESASSVIAPDGSLVGHAEYGVPGVWVFEIDPLLATGYLASRWKGVGG